MVAAAYPEGCGSGARRASGPPPGPARLASAALPPNNSGMRAPYPPRLPVPSGFAASGGGLRGPGPGCGPRLPGPGLAFGGPGCGSLAPGRCAALALAIARGPARRPGCGSPPGGPRCGGGVSGSRRLALAGPSATGPGVVPPALRAAAGPPAGVGGPWAAPCGRRAPSVPPRVPPALPPSLRAGGGPFGPPGAPPPGGRLGGPAGRLDQPPPPGLAGDGRRGRGCGRAELFRRCLCSLWEAPGSARCTLGIVLFMGHRGGPCRAASCSSDPAALRPLGYAKRGPVRSGQTPSTSTLLPYAVVDPGRTWPHTAGTPWRRPWWSLRRYD